MTAPVQAPGASARSAHPARAPAGRPADGRGVASGPGERGAAAPPGRRRLPGPRPDRTRRARSVVAGLLATAAAATTFGPLLEGWSWYAPTAVCLVAMGLGGLAATALRLPVAATVGLMAVGGTVVATALFAPERALLGGFVPTPSSLTDLGSLLSSGVQTSRAVLPPAPATLDLQALVVVAIAVVALAVVAMASLGAPGLAGLPLLLVVCVPAALSPDGIPAGSFLVAGAGYLALTLVDADERIQSWGPILRRRSRSGPTSSGTVLASLGGAVTVAAVTLGTAVVVPQLIPGLAREDLTDAIQDAFGAPEPQRVRTVNPFLDLRRDLTRPDDVAVLSYTTTDPAPDPLRIVTADVFDGSTWRPSEPALPGDQTLDGPLPPPPGAAPELLSTSEVVSTTISVSGLEQRYLPLPYPPTRVEIDGTWLYDPATLNVLSATDTTLGATYLVESFDVGQPVQTLQQAPAAPDGVAQRYGQLPPDLSPVVAETATSVTAGAETAFDQAVALQEFFRETGGFVYSLDAPDSGGVDVIESFLAERRGYCVQFSSTMAVMARTLGIPSRVAVGFLPGDAAAGGQYEVSVRDAHAWPELYFEGVGWVGFEPTPADRTGAAPGWSPSTDDAVAEPAPAPSEQAPVPSVAPDPAPQPDVAPPAVPDAAGPAAESSGRPWWLAAVGVVLLVVATGLAPRGWRAARDAVRWRRAGDDGRALAAAAWTVATERMSDLGWTWGRGTVREESAAVVAAWEPSGAGRAALARIVEAAERATYAATAAPAATLREDVATVVAAVGADRGRWTRLRAQWLPSPRPRGWRSSSAAASERSGSWVGSSR